MIGDIVLFSIPLELPDDDDKKFEEFIKDLLEKEYGFKLNIYGSKGEKQYGVDIAGRIPEKGRWTSSFKLLGLKENAVGKWIGIQAKARPNSKLKLGMLRDDYEEKLSESVLDIVIWLVFTSARRDARLFDELENLRNAWPLYGNIWFNQDIQRMYQKYFELYERYHPLYHPENVQKTQVYRILLAKHERWMMEEFGRWNEMVDELAKSGDFRNAAYAAEQASTIDPKNIEMWIKRTHLQLSGRQPDMALKTIKEATVAVAKIPELIWFRAVARSRMADIDGASDDFMEAYRIARTPSRPLVAGYVWSLIQKKELDDAEREVRKQITQDGGNDYWTLLLGYIQSLKNEHDKAIETFESVKGKIKNSGFEGYYGYALIETGSLRAGLPYVTASFNRLLSGSFPDKYKAALYSELGLLYTQAHEFDKAEKFFGKAQTLYDDFIGLWLGLASLYLAKRDMNSADKALQRAISIAPKNAVAHARLAHVRLRSGAIDDAHKHYSRAIELAEKSADDIRKAASMNFYFFAKRKQEEFLKTGSADSLKDAEKAASLSFYYVENEGAQQLLAQIRKGSIA